MSRRCLEAAFLVPVGSLAIVGGLALPFSALAGWAVVGGCAGTAVWALTAGGRNPHHFRRYRDLERAGVSVAVLVTASCLCVAGLVAVLGAEATSYLLLACLVLILPITLWLLLVGGPGRGWPVAGPRQGSEPKLQAISALSGLVAFSTPTTLMSMEDLCQAWRQSSGLLRATGRTISRGHLLRLREQLLDELERRDPAGFARWMGRGYRPDPDPSRHFTAPSPR